MANYTPLYPLSPRPAVALWGPQFHSGGCSPWPAPSPPAWPWAPRPGPLTRRHRAGLVGALLYLAGYPVWNWGALQRVDAFAVALEWVAIALFASAWAAPRRPAPPLGSRPLRFRYAPPRSGAPVSSPLRLRRPFPPSRRGPVGHRAPPPGGRVRPADGGGRGLRRVRHGPGAAPPPGPGRPRSLRRGRPGPVRHPGADHRGAVPAPHRGRQPERLGLVAGGLLLAAVLGPAALGRPPGGRWPWSWGWPPGAPAAPALHPRGAATALTIGKIGSNVNYLLPLWAAPLLLGGSPPATPGLPRWPGALTGAMVAGWLLVGLQQAYHVPYEPLGALSRRPGRGRYGASRPPSWTPYASRSFPSGASTPGGPRRPSSWPGPRSATPPSLQPPRRRRPPGGRAPGRQRREGRPAGGRR